jgi:hypothetical protein
MINVVRAAALVLIACLAGCATGAMPESMVPPPTGFAAASPLRGAVAMTQVSGGRETHPLWVSRVSNGDLEAAVLMALRNEGLLAADPGQAPMRLSVNLESVETPAIALAPSVTSRMRYVVTKDGQIVSDETVTATESAAFGDAALGVDRVRIASERSIRANIAEYFARLRQATTSG